MASNLRRKVNFTRDQEWTVKPESGLVVTDEMKEILAQPGVLNDSNGGKRLMYLYPNQSMGFRMEDLSTFGQACFVGNLRWVQQELATGRAPPLSNKESAYEQGYAQLIILGAQRIAPPPPGQPSPFQCEHLAVLSLLISRGLPVDLPDIAGFVALHAAMLGTPAMLEKEGLIRKLLDSGADVDFQNRWGSTALHNAVVRGDTVGIDLLMEYGADIEIPDGNGHTVKSFYTKAGPAVNATIEKWLLKRAGQEAPLSDRKNCDRCGRSDCRMKICSRCQRVQYCGPECQRAAWAGHKAKCKSYALKDPVALKPYYKSEDGTSFSLPFASLARGYLCGLPSDPVTVSRMRDSQPPTKLPPGGKVAVVKVQIPSISKDDNGKYRMMMAYTQKRDFACYIRREDNPMGWDNLYDVVKHQTLSGLKGYFMAEIKSREEFVVQIADPLASQPW